MKNFIPTNEAEKAAKEQAPFYPNDLRYNSFVSGYVRCSNDANAKFNTEIVPVLEKCREALEQSKREITILAHSYPSTIADALTQLNEILKPTI